MGSSSSAPPSLRDALAATRSGSSSTGRRIYCRIYEFNCRWWRDDFSADHVDVGTSYCHGLGD